MDQLSVLLYSKPGSNDVFNFTVLNIYNGHQVKFDDAHYQQYLQQFKSNLDEFLHHSSVQASMARVKNSRFAKLFVPIVYDHFLYKHWEQVTSVSKNDLIDQAHAVLLNNIDRAPKRAETTILDMVKKNVYHKYANLDGLPMINHCVHRFNPIYFQNAMNDFMRQYTAFQQDFEGYIPALTEKISSEITIEV
ncbi:MAG: acyl carrier protein phosphodiesterase [Cytophagaceae bacterium]|jgi:acyl carrier protein phosphodiesterase|nr:acyl carrier protein phosphodiesterase [Cytophagaceae bacterium]